MHCVMIFRSCFYIAYICFIDDRQAGPSKKAKLKKKRYAELCVSVSYFLNEWMVSSVLYVYIFIALFAYLEGFTTQKSGVWGSFQAPPYPLAGREGPSRTPPPPPPPPRGGCAYTPTIIYDPTTFCMAATALYV